MSNIEKSNTCGFVTTIAYDKLKAENDKLREFAKWAIYCAEGDLRCEGCPLRDKENKEYVVCKMRSVARSLGVEVEA